MIFKVSKSPSSVSELHDCISAAICDLSLLLKSLNQSGTQYHSSDFKVEIVVSIFPDGPPDPGVRK